FNWLFARHHGGKFRLRIEDTDRQRSTKAAVDAIIDGLSWLELGWDGDIVMQFARASRHAEAARQLLATGNAYYCYCTPAELEAMREKARAEGRSVRYDGTWRDRDQRLGAGHGHRGQRAARRSHHPALGWDVDLQSFRGGRRPRHGHHPRHPRRRPPQQRLPADADLSRPGLDGA